MNQAASHQVAADGEPGSGPLLVDGLLDGRRRCLGSHDVLFHRRDKYFPDLGEVSIETLPLQAFRITEVVARHRVSELGVCPDAFEPREPRSAAEVQNSPTMALASGSRLYPLVNAHWLAVLSTKDKYH